MSNKLRRMKPETGDKLVDQNCSISEFNFIGVGAGHEIKKDNGQYTYGMLMEEAEKVFL